MPSAFSTTEPPKVGADRLPGTTLRGVLASGSMSLATTLMVTGTPRVVAVSLTATGGWLGLTLTVTVAGSEASPLLSFAM
ncbi:hypothetical protein FQZ97_1071450 [compost metagenome]